MCWSSSRGSSGPAAAPSRCGRRPRPRRIGRAPERFPEAAMCHGPGAERRRGIVAGIDVDEECALGFQRDRQLEREAGINLRKSRWDNDLSTRYGQRVSPGVSEGCKPYYPLGLRQKRRDLDARGLLSRPLRGRHSDNRRCPGGAGRPRPGGFGPFRGHGRPRGGSQRPSEPTSWRWVTHRTRRSSA